MTHVKSIPFAILLLGFAAISSAQDPPKYLSYMSRFEELRAKYSDRYPAVVLEDRSDVQLILREWFQKFSRETSYAVFDPNRAEEALEYVIPIPPGSKIKTLRTWSFRSGDAKPLFSKPADVHTRRTIGAWKEARIGVPGMAGPGVCGLQIVYERDGLGATGDSFVDAFPVLRASFRVVVPSVNSFEATEMIGQFDEYLMYIVRGKPEAKPPFVGPDGLEWSWKFTDIPARFKDPLTPARDQPQAGVYMRQRFARWEYIVKGFMEGMEELKAPVSMVTAIRSGSPRASTRETVEAVARYLDDPKNFRLLTRARYFGISLPDLKEIEAKKEGTSFDKTVLAHLLLTELGVENFMALAASRYRSDLDWEMCNPNELDASLIYLPGEPEGSEIWDVADLSTPIGIPGPDLHSGVLVLIPETKSPITLYKIAPGRISENRKTVLRVGDDGELLGNVDWRFNTWPSFEGLDPWDPAADLDEPLGKSTGQRAKVTEPSWAVPEGALHRCTGERPAVLNASVSMEASPRGDDGWELKPLFWSPPDFLPARVDPKRVTRALLARAVEIADTAIVMTAGLAAESLPPPVHVGNPVGTFDCGWSVTGDSLIACRSLKLRAGDVAPEQAKDLDQILAAWQGSVGQGVVVRPGKKE